MFGREVYIGTNQLQLDSGVLKIVTGTDPAANVECSDTVPANKAWEVLSWMAALVTDANVANRRTRLVLDDGTTDFYRGFSLVDQVASTTMFHTFARMGFMNGGTAANLANVNSYPELLLAPGYRIRTDTLNRQAGDNYGAPKIFVVEYDVGD